MLCCGCGQPVRYRGDHKYLRGTDLGLVSPRGLPRGAHQLQEGRLRGPLGYFVGLKGSCRSNEAAKALAGPLTMLSCPQWLSARNGTAQKAPARTGSAGWGPAASALGQPPEPTQGSGETPGTVVGSGVPVSPGARGPNPAPGASLQHLPRSWRPAGGLAAAAGSALRIRPGPPGPMLFLKHSLW